MWVITNRPRVDMNRGFFTQNNTPGLLMQTHICGHKNAIATVKSGCVLFAQLHTYFLLYKKSDSLYCGVMMHFF